MPDDTLVGPVTVGPIAHGGHCVARYEGRVIFVRHALPGEIVRVALTDQTNDRFWRGDAVEVLQASPDRVPTRCPIAGPGRCGGCDFQHVDLAAQRSLKTQVVAEQLQRLAGLTWSGQVEAVPGPGPRPGLDWRTRMRYHVDDQGRAGLRAHRSHQVVALPDDGCPIAAADTPPVTGQIWPAGAELQAVAAADGPALLVDTRLQLGAPVVREQAAGRTWEVAVEGFWQVHPAAADTLVAAVLDGARPQPGERAFDLYCGVGLFAGALIDAGCQVWGVEASRSAIEHARRNLADAGRRARFSADRVDRLLARPPAKGGLPRRTDLVILDPPRTGAGRDVMLQIAARAPRTIGYVACDPAALARDLGTIVKQGYRLAGLRAFDLFPMTHHVECVAIITR